MARKKTTGDKTNVMRILDTAGVPYTAHAYKADPAMSGSEIAQLLGEDTAKVFKTLVTRGRSGEYYVFVVPVNANLDLKKAAKAAGEKSIAMILQKELLPLTGYVHGGCSPIGMKKQFQAFVNESAESLDRIYVSAGKVGMQIELSPEDLARIAELTPADLI